MMRKLMLSTAFIALCVGTSSAYAASTETDAFVANVRLNDAFLEQASRLAHDRSENNDLRAFAGKEAQAIEGVTTTIDLRVSPEIASREVPIAVASNDVVTGRSVAVDGTGETTSSKVPVGTGAMMPAAMVILDHLAASKGEAFDALYKATQINALRQLASFYNAYGMTGDDPALKQLAKSELAATNDRIAEIARL